MDFISLEQERLDFYSFRAKKVGFLEVGISKVGFLGDSCSLIHDLVVIPLLIDFVRMGSWFSPFFHRLLMI